MSLLLNLLVAYDTVGLIIGPSYLGWPVMRDRLFTWSCCRDSMVWVGPRGPALQEDFSLYCQRRAQLDGDVFAKIDSESNQLQELNRIARARKMYVDEGALKDPDALLHLLAPQVRCGAMVIG